MRYRTGREISLGNILFFLLVATSGVYLPIFSIGGVSVRFFELVTLAWCICCLPQKLDKIKLDSTLISLYLLLMSLLASMLLINFHQEGLVLFLRIVVVACILVMIQVSVVDEGVLERAVRVYTYSGIVIIIIGIIALVLANMGIVHLRLLVETTFSGRGYRIQSFLPGSNRFGNYSALIFSIVFIEALISRTINSKKVLNLVICFGGVLLSGSRGALFSSILACLIVFGIYMIRYKHSIVLKRSLVFATLGALVSFAIISNMEVSIFTRILGETASSGGTINDNIRLIYFGAIIDRILTGIATFLFGIGFYGQSDYLTIGGAAFTPHNTYLTVLSAQGIIGLMIFVHMILRILFKGLKILLNGSGNDLSGIKTPVSLLTGFIILLVHYNTIGLYTTGYVWVFIALTIASFRRSRAIQVREGSECRGGLKWKEQK